MGFCLTHSLQATIPVPPSTHDPPSLKDEAYKSLKGRGEWAALIIPSKEDKSEH